MRDFKISNEDKEKFKNKRIEYFNSLTLAYQLGMFVGKEIVHKFLPTLSIDGIVTNTNISVTCTEGDKYRKLQDIWFKNSYKNDAKNEWFELQEYYKLLLDKYLPEKVECHFKLLNIPETDITDFKNGIRNSLIDSDCCHYKINIDDIDIKNDDDYYFTIITLNK